MLESRGGRRVVVTGVGVVSPGGTGKQEFWAGLSRPVEPATVRRVPHFDPAQWGLRKVESRRLDRFGQFGLAAAAQALTDAGFLTDPAHSGPLPDLDPERGAVLIGSGLGGALVWQARAVSPLAVPMVLPNAAAAACSMRWQLRGPCEAISTAGATGNHAIAGAARWIAAGRADVALAGGAEASLTATNVAAYTTLRALSASGISRPFDRDRDGFCLAEGAGVLVLEEALHAASRGVRPYAELAGAAATADAHHLTAPEPAGRGAVSCMRAALADAGVSPADVTHISAHGTSTRLNDAAEARAIAQLFGTVRPAVSAVKGVTGHAQGAAGAIGAVALALTYAHRSLPPTMGTVAVDPDCPIEVVRAPQPWRPAAALSNSFGFGGHNGTLVFLPA